MPLKEFTFLDVYRRNAEFFPDRTAFVFEGQRITHREYLKRVERLAAGGQFGKIVLTLEG